MSMQHPVTMVMVDDNVDEIFLTRRQVRRGGIVNHFVSERNSENLINTLTELYNVEAVSEILVLMDINMPRMDGFETLRRLRDHKQFKNLPVIMFSASDDEADVNRAAKLGANGYMIKPFTIDTFISALGNIPDVKYHLFLGPLGTVPQMKYHLVQ
jgi:CheY-like chemotaxis protein